MFSAAVYTLGCKLNQLESEAIAGAFSQAGFSLIQAGGAHAAPDILVINTCTVTATADQKARHLVRKVLRENPRSCVIVTGCYAELEAGAIAALEPADEPALCALPGHRPGQWPGQWPGHRLFVLRGGNKDALLDLPRWISTAIGPASGPADGTDLRALIDAWHTGRRAHSPPVPGGPAGGAFRFAPEHFSFHTRAFLKIQDGCDCQCSYCRVRLARGPSVSRDAAAALAALRALEAKGYAEAMITGVNITQYRDGRGGGLAELLAYLLEGTGRIALRLSSLEPEGVSGRLAPVLANRRIRPHFHLSVQSGSAAILAAMNRPYGPETVERAAALLRSIKTDPFLACDIITGFPGETAAEFERTLSLCRSLDCAWIHAFPYSPRPGTPACSFPNQVSGRDAAHRVETLMALARQGRETYVRRWLGHETEVLVEAGEPERSAPAGCCRGITENYLKVRIRHAGPRPPPPGTVLCCNLTALSALAGYDAEAAEIP